tara:strand:- start:34 stop:513 length:480 start_codon:yes stop_codon:yes gene_type:complete
MDNEIAEFIENDAMNRIYLRHAYQYAQAYSKHPSTQQGAILVKPSVGVIGWGVNALIGVNPNKEGNWESPIRNVIYKCAERGICTTGLILYSPWFPCIECVRAAIQSGISAAVGHELLYDRTDDYGISMLKDAGVLTKKWSGKIGNKVSVRINNEDISP